jgi:hypothetical protein
VPEAPGWDASIAVEFGHASKTFDDCIDGLSKIFLVAVKVTHFLRTEKIQEKK